MNHLRNINYPGSLDQLATDLGNLRYDALADFLKKLADKLAKDSDADLSRHRVKLAAELAGASECVKRAWEICKPFMEK